MFCMLERRNRKTMDRMTLFGSGIKAKKIADGKCVNTIVLIRPIRFEMEDATRFEMEDMMLLTKNRVPSCPSGRANFRVKK